MQPKVNSRLHHTAYVTRDMEATRKFYEEVVGFPLAATWCEKTHLFGKERTYMHCFFEIGNGESLAFFQFADEEDADEFGPSLPPSGFRHIAMKVDEEAQKGIVERLDKAGYTEPTCYVLEHGYCRSLYVTDPAGMLVEFTVDHSDIDNINAERRKQAREEMDKWLSGDHSPNNLAFHR